LFPRNLSSPAASPATWRISRIPSALGVNQFVAPPCAPHLHSVPPHGRAALDTALLASCSRALIPRFHALRTRAAKLRFHGTTFQNCLLIRFSSHFRRTVSTQPVVTESSVPIFRTNVSW
jgi:hypothetical protein